MTRIQEEQQRRNQRTRGCWELYADHRRRVTELLVGPHVAAPMLAHDGDVPANRLCVLGAGNCNDLDLPRLLTRFGQIHLVDLDGQALSAGVAAQHLDAEPRISLYPDIDVSGLANQISNWSADHTPPAAEIDTVLIAAAQEVPLPLVGSFDTVASICLLSQLFDAIKLALGDQHPQYLSLVQAVRARHLRQAVDQCRQGGHLLLVSDFISSDTCADLATVSEAQLPALCEQLIRTQNFFTGLNPFVLRQLFVSDPYLAKHATQVRLFPPWRWTFPARVYAVYAITAIRM
jgi:hypothetical protein